MGKVISYVCDVCGKQTDNKADVYRLYQTIVSCDMKKRLWQQPTDSNMMCYDCAKKYIDNMKG